MKSIRLVALPFLALSVSALTIAAAYALQVSADLATSSEYAEYRNDRWHFSLAVPPT